MRTSKPLFGDHKLITFNITGDKEKIPFTFRRDWRKYTKEVLISELNQANWKYGYDTVQSCWNSFESTILRVVDKLAPLVKFVNNSVKNYTIPAIIKKKINRRKKLLNKQKTNSTVETVERLKSITKEIKKYFHGMIKNKVRRGIKNQKIKMRAVEQGVLLYSTLVTFPTCNLPR